jgi:hypothetical protein
VIVDRKPAVFSPRQQRQQAMQEAQQQLAQEEQREKEQAAAEAQAQAQPQEQSEGHAVARAERAGDEEDFAAPLAPQSVTGDRKRLGVPGSADRSHRRSLSKEGLKGLTGELVGAAAGALQPQPGAGRRGRHSRQSSLGSVSVKSGGSGGEGGGGGGGGTGRRGSASRRRDRDRERAGEAQQQPQQPASYWDLNFDEEVELRRKVCRSLQFGLRRFL